MLLLLLAKLRTLFNQNSKYLVVATGRVFTVRAAVRETLVSANSRIYEVSL